MLKKPINRESNILKRYFGKSKGVILKDIRDFMTRNEIPKNVVNHIHVCESDDDVVKLMEIFIVESILFGKKTESSVMRSMHLLLKMIRFVLNILGVMWLMRSSFTH